MNNLWAYRYHRLQLNSHLLEQLFFKHLKSDRRRAVSISQITNRNIHQLLKLNFNKTDISFTVDVARMMIKEKVYRDKKRIGVFSMLFPDSFSNFSPPLKIMEMAAKILRCTKTAFNFFPFSWFKCILMANKKNLDWRLRLAAVMTTESQTSCYSIYVMSAIFRQSTNNLIPIKSTNFYLMKICINS